MVFEYIIISIIALVFVLFFAYVWYGLNKALTPDDIGYHTFCKFEWDND